jgi:hypothetical protein
MAYSLPDLLERLVVVKESSVNIFEAIANNSSQSDKRISIVSRVFKAEEMRHIQHYRELLEESKVQVNTDIDFDIYDKIYSLINEFKNRIAVPKVSTVQELVSFTFDFEMSVTALLLDIRGRMVRSSNDAANFNYVAITQLILEEQKHAASISTFIK